MAGTPVALQEIYQRHAADVFRYALFLSGSRAEAEDIFTLMPFSFAFSGGHITFFMMRDQPASGLFFLSAAWLWFDYIRQTRRLHAKLP